MSKRIDHRELMAAAAAQTGLDYLDRDFVEPLQRFVDSVDEEGNLGDAAIEGFKQNLTRLLTNRLGIEAAFAAHPEIADEDVSDPIVITGLPRTGTTKLQKVLAVDPRHQKLPLWKALFPVPLAPAGTDPDPRITITEEQAAVMAEQFPEFMAAHPMRTHEPEEEMLLLQLSFRSFGNAWFYRSPSYLEWVERQDQTPAYTDLRRALQYLQWQDGGRRGRPWVLKSPAHLSNLDVLLAMFPAATVVHCHRAVDESLPSLARLLEVIQLSRGAQHVDIHELGTFLIRHGASLWSRNFAQREALDGRAIVDVRYETIRDDIGSVVSEIYARRGTALDDRTRGAMLNWEQDNPAHSAGKHVYSLERFGMTREALDLAFAEYLTRLPRLTDL